MFTELEFIAAIRRQQAIDAEWDRDPLAYIERVGLPPNFTVQAGLAIAQDTGAHMEGRMGVYLGDRERKEVYGALSATWIKGVGVGLDLGRQERK